ncbi:hypothetical protein CANARDRAFT_7755 [[Candida] arabinofermentans NRRL YB-2248]|uniref:Ubiquinone biosynthesis monooxygenase COQ6, mitochondrial n=1 Tax=[Candida] arabinofermentans NRRL YB-2248 TaxID=983967 RepID=A0A1E4T1S6_9ASCO|nr:hypothetical protein CANARDRAFT_7755 [[Candida] arabinofermentans NRRL YB-2248]
MFRRLLSTAVKSTVPQTADVVIIGGGPAGLTLAAAIKNSPVLKNLNCKLIEGGNLIDPLESFHTTTPEDFMNRVVSLTPATISYLQEIKAWDYVKEERTETYDSIHAYDGVTGSKIEFDSPEIATMCENFNLQSALLQRIKDLNEVSESDLEIVEKTKVIEITTNEETNWPIVQLSNGDSIQTRLLVGCDGFNSPVRKFAGIESRGWSYDRWGIVATMKYKNDAFRYPTGWQRFLKSGPLAQLPLPNGWCSLVWSTTPELANILMKLPEDQFIAMVNAGAKLSPEEMGYLYDLAAKNDDTLIDEINWRLSLFNSKLKPEEESSYPLELESMVTNSRGRFPLRLSHADTYVDERIALVGDAAHTTHPLAGQGLNMGQADVKSLVHTLEVSAQRGLDIGTKFALEPYFSERYPENHVMLGIVDKIHKIYSTDSTPIVMARSFGVDVINNLPFLKDFMVSQISNK